MIKYYPKIFLSQNNEIQKMLVIQNVSSKKFDPKLFWLKKFFGQNIFCDNRTACCVLCKFGLLKSCQPITGHRPTDRQNPVLISLAYLLRLRLVPSDLTTGLLTCFSLRKSQLACRLKIRLFPSDLTTCFLPVSL